MLLEPADVLLTRVRRALALHPVPDDPVRSPSRPDRSLVLLRLRLVRVRVVRFRPVPGGAPDLVTRQGYHLLVGVSSVVFRVAVRVVVLVVVVSAERGTVLGSGRRLRRTRSEAPGE